MSTAVDFAARLIRPQAIKDAGHAAVLAYVSPSRPGSNFGAKPITREYADECRRVGLELVSIWQLGKPGNPTPSDWTTSYEGGRRMALEARDTHFRIGGPGYCPIFFAVDEDINLTQWNSTAVHFFRGACDAIGRAWVGIYGSARVCAWAIEDNVIGGRDGARWAWQTRAWSNGVREPEAVLFQRVIDTPSQPGPKIDGSSVDVNDILAPDYGQWSIDRSPGQPGPVPPPVQPPREVTPVGDPVWLPEVLRAEGLTVNEFPGWRERGHGDFGAIWGVVAHHTGASGSPGPGAIANHPSLGLASQLHLARDGVVTVCGAGVAWHAGNGSWPGIAANNANAVTIGIEAENNGTEGWSPIQYWAYVKTVAAILRRIGQPASHLIAHKEWAGPSQGKWDPGNMDMNAFRADVDRQIAGGGAPAVNLIDEKAAQSPWLGARKTAGEITCPDGKGRFAEFENGFIYWHPDTGVHPIPTHLFETWAELGWEAGQLGYPVADHTVLPVEGDPKVGDVQAFQKGILYRKYGLPGFFVRGAIAGAWGRGGFERGILGWPTSNEIVTPGGARQTFEAGTIHWVPSTILATRASDGEEIQL